MRLPLRAALTLALAATDAAAQTTRCTTETIGQQTYTRCSDGYRSTSERIGSQIYTRDNRGTRGTTESIGSTLYYRDNTGTRATTERIGSMDYTTIRSNAGTGRVTEQRIGTTNYLSGLAPGAATGVGVVDQHRLHAVLALHDHAAAHVHQTVLSPTVPPVAI